MGASQCKVWYLNCGRQGHAVWLCDIEGAKPQLRVMVDGECVFAGDPATVPEHGEILRQPLEKAALVVSMEKTPKQPIYRVTWDGRDYEDDLALLQSKKSTVDMADVYKVRLKAMEVKMEDAPVKEGSAQVKSTAFFTIIANLYTTRNDKHGKLKSPSSSGQIQVCSGVSSHRFSALLDVHDKIGAYYAASLPDVKMPKKPEKSVKGTSGVSTSDADFIGQRKMAIDKWLSGLCSLPRLVYLPDFVEFFGLPSIRPKYCGGHIVFTQPTSLESPAHQPREKAGGEELDAAATAAAAAAADAGAAGGGGGGGAKGAPAADGGFQPSDSDDEEYVVVAEKPEKPKEEGAFETVDDFDDFNASPSKAGAGMEVPEAYSVEGVREVGLTMFGEEEDDEEGAAKPTGAAAAVADIDAEHARTVAAGGQSGDGGGDGDGAAAAPPPVELTPVERLLQAESKLSLYQERLDQAEEGGKHGLVDKLYDEIAKLQKQVFVLQEEAEAYEAAHAPTEAELWEEEDDGAVQIVEQPVSAGGVLANTPRRMTSTGGDEWGDFAAGGDDDDEWGDGGDGGDDPFGGGAVADSAGEGGASAGAAAATAGGPAPGGDDAGGDPFAGNDEWE